MRMAMVGLGKMGAGMTRRLLRAGHEVVGFDVDAESVRAVTADGAIGVHRRDGRSTRRRVVWLMLPAGPITNDSIDHVSAFLQAGDVIIDGGNSCSHRSGAARPFRSGARSTSSMPA